MIADVTAVLMRDFSANMQARLDALGRGVSADQIEASKPASGLAIGDPGRTDGAQTGVAAGSSSRTSPTEAEENGMLWWIGNALLLLVVVPVLVALLNRVLAALERIRGASDEILAGGVALIGELDGVPDLLATTDRTINDVSVGAVRYAGSVAKLLG